jgi:Spy/CpxP family protein refolding chaperone
MKLITKIAVLGALCAMAVGAFAQGRGGMRGGFQQNKYMLLRSKDIQTDLKLSDDQVKKLTDLQTKQQEDMRSAFQNAQASGSPPDPAEMKKINDGYTSQFDAVLTGDQKMRLDQLFVQWQKGRALTNEEVQNKLGLSDDQKAKIKDLMDKYNEANRALFQKVQNQEISREDMQTTMKQNTDTLNDQLGKVLTDSQTAKFKDMQGAPFTGQWPTMGGGRRGGGGPGGGGGGGGRAGGGGNGGGGGGGGR